MRRASVLSILVLSLGLGAGACKGSTVYKDSQDTLDKMSSLQKQLDAQKAQIQQLSDANAACERDKGTGGELAFVIEGDLLKIKPGKPGASHPGIDDATAGKQSQAFLDIVQRSRGAIQKCYEQALKKNSGLQSRTISLKLSAKFSSAGDFNGSSFNPSLGDTFDNCLRTVAGRWKMPAAPAAMTFEASVSLSPT
jgi:hypothetical protein